jgi:hypothetical protein
MLKNVILVSAVSFSFVACGGGGSGGGSAGGAGATCEQVFKADQVIDANNCENIFDLLSNESYSSVNLETAELCYSTAKIIQSAAGKTCTDAETGESSELASVGEFAEMMKPLDEAIVALRRYNGVSVASPAPVVATPATSNSGTKCEQAAAIYAEQDRLQCDQFEEGVSEEDLQTKEQQVVVYNALKPCVASLEKLQKFAGLTCSDFDVAPKNVFDALLPAMRFAMQQMHDIINKP